MEQLLTEIRIALDNKLYFIALQAALTIPDICGAIQSNNGLATKDKYCGWYDKYAKNKISTYILAEDIYLFRCSLLHQGTTVPSPRCGQTATYSRIVFAAPYSKIIWVHDAVIIDALFVDLPTFCNGVLEAAKEWLTDMKKDDNANYIKNIEKAIRYYPKGISPYIAGIDTIG